MKLLIIAGPYEADRIRRAAVLAGFEAVAVEPGESLSGWITATRPDVIVLAPHIVSPDLNTALGKVRSVPRGRVPIFLVGDEEDRESLQDQADGFFVRPVSPDELFARARDAVTLASSSPRAGDDPTSAPHDTPGSGPHAKVTGGADDSGRVRPSGAAEGTATRPPTLKPLIAAARGAVAPGPIPAAHDFSELSPRTGSLVPRPASPGRKTSETWPPVRREGDAIMLAALAEDIEADFDAELRDVVRAVGALRAAEAMLVPPAPPTHAPATLDEDDAADLADEPGQKTLEVPSSVSAALIETDRGPRVEAAGLAPDGGATRAFVLSLHARVMEADYFQILGVRREATASDIQNAHDRLLAELAPEALSPAMAKDLEYHLVEIRAVLAEAARLLLNDAVRGRYQSHLPSLDVQP